MIVDTLTWQVVLAVMTVGQLGRQSLGGVSAVLTHKVVVAQHPEALAMVADQEELHGVPPRPNLHLLPRRLVVRGDPCGRGGG